MAAGRPLCGALSASTIASVLWAIFNTACWASAVWPSGPLPLATCFSVCLLSGALIRCSSAWFCHRQNPNAIASAIALTIRRVRSSSRWSTRLSLSSWPIARIVVAMAHMNLPPPPPVSGATSLGLGGPCVLANRRRYARCRPLAGWDRHYANLLAASERAKGSATSEVDEFVIRPCTPTEATTPVIACGSPAASRSTSSIAISSCARRRGSGQRPRPRSAAHLLPLRR